jgi:copper homeostasis protein
VQGSYGETRRCRFRIGAAISFAARAVFGSRDNRNQTMTIVLEVCCGSVDDAVEAQAAGADRVELNSSIFLGGLTPTIGTMREAKRKLDIPVVAMVRPRGGGFCYTETEFAAMCDDTELLVANGADAIVFGILDEKGEVDMRRCAEIVRLGQGVDMVFHRAIDVAPDPFRVIDQLVELGIRRVLTAGQQNSAIEGVEMVRDLIGYAKGRLEILPGGVAPHNVRTVIDITGCQQVHMAAFKAMPDTSTMHKPHIYFGFALYPSEDRYDLTDRAVVNKVKSLLPG